MADVTSSSPATKTSGGGGGGNRHSHSNPNDYSNISFENATREDMDYLLCLDICPADVCAVLEDAVRCIEDFIFPTPMEWLFICLHIILFTIGVVGNILVCLVVLRSKHMQTVTNLFIVNLAMADAVVLVFCSPPTVLRAVTESWFLGDVMCKVVIFIQNIVVGVSVLTLCAIAIERYFAICRPLRSRITVRKVSITICIIWVVSAVISSPNLTNIVTDTFKQKELSKYLKICGNNLGLDFQYFYYWFLIVTVYLVPMLIIAIFYLIISHHLWNVTIPGSTIRDSGDHSSGYRTHAELQLASRKKVAKMLIAIVVLFAACYFPLNLIFLLRLLRILETLEGTAILPIVFMFAHWLCYFNSAVNPLIYNFMSVKFKKEFRNVFSRRGRHNTLNNHNECSLLPSTRAVLRNTDHTNLTAVRIMRTQDSTGGGGGHTRLREANHNKRVEDLGDINHSESV